MFKRFELEQYFLNQNDKPVPAYIIMADLKYPVEVETTSHIITEFMFVLEGRANSRIENTDYKISENDFYIVNPTIMHTEFIRPNTTSEGMRYYILGIKNIAFTQKDGKNLAKPVHLSHNSRIKTLINWLYEECSEQNVNPKNVNLIFELLINTITSFYKTETIQITYNTKDDLINSIKKFIDENYLGSLSMDYICKKFHCNKNTLAHNFKKVTGKSVMQYVQDKTLEEAKNWMKISNFNVTQISIRFGFCSPAYFTLAFKKAFGITPKEYIKQIKSEKEKS